MDNFVVFFLHIALLIIPEDLVGGLRRFNCMAVSVKRRLRTADCRLRTRGKMQTECKMQTAD